MSQQTNEILAAAKTSLEKASTNQRYRFGIAAADAQEIMLAAYKFNLQDRGQELADEETTMKHIVSAANWLTGDHKPGLLLFGGVGNGKTTLANAIADTVDSVLDSISRWENSPKNMKSFNLNGRSELRQHINFSRATVTSALSVSKYAGDQDAFTRIIKAPFLVLDDLGCEPPVVKRYGNEISPVSEILYYRYETLLPTILTSNLDKAGLRDFYGPRIADRLEELCESIGFNNQSYRK